MSLQQLYNKLKNKEDIPELTQSGTYTLKRNVSLYFSLPILSNNDTISFTINEIRAITNNYRITFNTYMVRNRQLVDDAENVFIPLSATNFSRDLVMQTQYYIEMKSNQDIEFDFSWFIQGYIVNKDISAQIDYGENIADMDLTVTRRPPPRYCDVPLRYYLIDGYLPQGLELTADGIIQGHPCNLDDMDAFIKDAEQYSPSFNWFFENTDNQTQAIGMVFRFKVRVQMAGLSEEELLDPEYYSERWFCIRVYNNWSIDKSKGLDIVRTEREITICPVSEEEYPEIQADEFCKNICDDIGINTIPNKPAFRKINFQSCCLEEEAEKAPDKEDYKHIQFLQNVPVLSECKACHDPTKPYKIEIIKLEKYFHNLQEILQYYVHNKQVGAINDETLAKLSNSQLFNELLVYLNTDDVRNTTSLIEARYINQTLTLIKFQDEYPLNDPSTIMINTRNKNNQPIPIEVNCYMGEELYAIYYQN